MSGPSLRAVQRVAAYTLLTSATVAHAGPASARVPELPELSDDHGSLPGGPLRHGEPPDRAAVRMAREAAGVDVALTGLRTALADVVDDPVRGLSVHTVRIVYQARPVTDADAGSVDGARDEQDTPDGRPDGRPDARPDARPDGDGPPQVQRTGAYALVVDDGRVLLSRYVGDGRWSLPGGGIDHGEQPVEALHREVREETGLALHDVRLVDVDSVHFTGHSPRGELEDFHAVRIVYTGAVPPGSQPQVLEVEGTTDAASWFPIDALDRIEITALVRRALHLFG